MSDSDSHDTREPREAPLSDGADVAHYSSSHKLQPAHEAGPHPPKVVVEKPRPRPTVRIDRLGTVEPTRGRKVVIALIVVIVLLLAGFLAMRRWAIHLKADAVRANPSASALVNPPKPLIDQQLSR